MVRGKKNFLPHAPLIMGFTVLFKLVSPALCDYRKTCQQ